MNDHAGAACALSALIVGVFTILLHDKNPPPIASKATVSSARPKPDVDPSPLGMKSSDRPTLQPIPIPTVDNPRSPAPDLPPKPSKITAVTGPSPEKPATRVAEVPSADRNRPSTSKPTTLPKTPFTVVRDGESLLDVANRIYGSAQAAESLWRANRDQLAAVSSPVPRGTLLRTP